MGESVAHANLRTALVSWIENNFGRDICACVLVDAPDTRPGNFPPNIEGYVPDMYLRIPINQQLIIGEAKSAGDLETRHSREQLAAYLRYLALYPNSIFIIAVPWFVVNQAKSLIWSIQKRNNASNVNLVFLEKLPG